jgi:N-acetylmuramic acid 6-phosphate etherase
MKAGTAQKLILNMISTIAMIRLGYVRGNRMTNMKASNEKLQDRAVRIVMEETGIEAESASGLMHKADGDLRIALVMQRTGATANEARRVLDENGWVIEAAVAAGDGDAKNPGSNNDGAQE